MSTQKLPFNEAEKSGASEDELRNVLTLSQNQCAINFMQFVSVVNSQFVQH